MTGKVVGQRVGGVLDRSSVPICSLLEPGSLGSAVHVVDEETTPRCSGSEALVNELRSQRFGKVLE